MEERRNRQPLSVVAVFTKDFAEVDVETAKSGLDQLGFKKLWLMTGLPPKLSVAMAPDAEQERIDEVVAFLEGVEHVEAVRISYPS
ncbi:MAG: hypothetical protein ACLPVF_15995 [Acidimicrobiales bacterium]